MSAPDFRLDGLVALVTGAASGIGRGIALGIAGSGADLACLDLVGPALEQWQRVVDVDYTGVFLSCQAEARVTLPRGRGAIVTIASMSGSVVNRGLRQAHDNSAKAGSST